MTFVSEMREIAQKKLGEKQAARAAAAQERRRQRSQREETLRRGKEACCERALKSGLAETLIRKIQVLVRAEANQGRMEARIQIYRSLLSCDPSEGVSSPNLTREQELRAYTQKERAHKAFFSNPVGKGAENRYVLDEVARLLRGEVGEGFEVVFEWKECVDDPDAGIYVFNTPLRSASIHGPWIPTEKEYTMTDESEVVLFVRWK